MPSGNEGLADVDAFDLPGYEVLNEIGRGSQSIAYLVRGKKGRFVCKVAREQALDARSGAFRSLQREASLLGGSKARRAFARYRANRSLQNLQGIFGDILRRHIAGREAHACRSQRIWQMALDHRIPQRAFGLFLQLPSERLYPGLPEVDRAWRKGVGRGCTRWQGSDVRSHDLRLHGRAVGHDGASSRGHGAPRKVPQGHRQRG